MRGERMVLLAAAMCVAVAAGAQTRPRHQGLNLGLGVQQGNLRVSCTACTFPVKEGSLTFTGQLGWTLSDAVIVTSEMQIYTKHQTDNRGDDANTNYQMGAIVGMWYPSRRWEHHFNVGFGLSHSAISLDTGLGLRDVRSTGPLMRMGFGTDLRLGRTWSVTPSVDYSLGLAANTNVDNLKIKASMLSFGAALTWR